MDAEKPSTSPVVASSHTGLKGLNCAKLLLLFLLQPTEQSSLRRRGVINTHKQVSVIQISLCWSCCRVADGAKPTAAMDEETLMIVAQFKDFNIHHPHRLVLMVWVIPPDISSSPTLKTVVPLVPKKYLDLMSRLRLHYKLDKSGISFQSLICFCWVFCVLSQKHAKKVTHKDEWSKLFVHPFFKL